MTSSRAPAYDFHGHAVRRLTYRGQLAFIGREVGAALGYDEAGKRFVSQLTAEWSKEIRQGVHWFRVKGEDLREIKASMRLGTASVPSGEGAVPSQDPGLRTPELVLLTEEGLTLALMKSGKPVAVEFRTWLASEVVPQIARTGKYDPAPALRPPRLSREAAALKRLVGSAIGAGRLDVAADLIAAARKLTVGPGERLLPMPARHRASNRLLAGLIQRGALKPSDHHVLLLGQPAWRPGEKAVLGLLLELADDQQRIEGRCPPELAERLGLTKRTVRDALRVLERARVLDGERGAYTLHLEALEDWTGKARPEEWGRVRPR